jgi:hypothetical protein
LRLRPLPLESLVGEVSAMLVKFCGLRVGVRFVGSVMDVDVGDLAVTGVAEEGRSGAGGTTCTRQRNGRLVHSIGYSHLRTHNSSLDKQLTLRPSFLSKVHTKDEEDED